MRASFVARREHCDLIILRLEIQFTDKRICFKEAPRNENRCSEEVRFHLDDVHMLIFH